MSQIDELEAQKNDRKKLVEFRDLILKLGNNPEFRQVIKEEYFVHEAARNVRIGGDMNMTPEMRQDALNMGMAAGHLMRFLSARIQMGNMAENDIKQIDEALDEIRSENNED